MPPHCACASTTTCLTRKAWIANSSAADIARCAPSGVYGGTRLAMLRATNNSPGLASKITSGDTRERQPGAEKFGVAVDEALGECHGPLDVTPRSPLATRKRRAAADRGTAAPI